MLEKVDKADRKCEDIKRVAEGVLAGKDMIKKVCWECDKTEGEFLVVWINAANAKWQNTAPGNVRSWLGRQVTSMLALSCRLHANASKKTEDKFNRHLMMNKL